MTTRKRRSLGDISRDVQSYLFNRDEAKNWTAKKAKLAKELRDFVMANGVVELDETDEEVTGNIVYKLPEPIVVGTKTYTGMELRKKLNVSFDEGAAIALAESKGIPRNVIGHDEFVVDQDAFYVLNQQKKITDAELDALLVEDDPDYSLWPLVED
jgi:hypothetical protein